MKTNQLRSYDLYVQNQSKKEAAPHKIFVLFTNCECSTSFSTQFQIYSLTLIYLKHINFTHSPFFCSKLYDGNFGYLNDYFKNIYYVNCSVNATIYLSGWN